MLSLYHLYLSLTLSHKFYLPLSYFSPYFTCLQRKAEKPQPWLSFVALAWEQEAEAPMSHLKLTVKKMRILTFLLIFQAHCHKFVTHHNHLHTPLAHHHTHHLHTPLAHHHTKRVCLNIFILLLF